MIEIKPCAIAEIHDSGILAQGYAEYAITGMPEPDVQWATYLNMERTGMLTVFGAYHDRQLVGFISLLSNVSLHYGCLMAITESFFVLKEHRKTGAGSRLLQVAHHYAAAIGATGLLVTAPHDKELSKVLPALGYQPTHNVYFRQVNHE